MKVDRPDFWHDSPEVCVNKLFNTIQNCRQDAAVMRGRTEEYKIDSEVVKVAKSLVRELEAMVQKEAN